MVRGCFPKNCQTPELCGCWSTDRCTQLGNALVAAAVKEEKHPQTTCNLWSCVGISLWSSDSTRGFAPYTAAAVCP